MSEPNNPFVGLLGTSESGNAENATHAQNLHLREPTKSTQLVEAETVNNIVENVFYFTINDKAVDGQTDKQLVYLEELSIALKPHKLIDLEALEQGLFERLLLPEVKSSVIPKTSKVFKEHVIQHQVFPYLFSSIQNLQSYEQVNNVVVQNVVAKMKELIFRNAVTALKQPALFEEQDFSVQLLELLQHVDPQSHTFFIDIVKAFMIDGKLCNYLIANVLKKRLTQFFWQYAYRMIKYVCLILTHILTSGN